MKSKFESEITALFNFTESSSIAEFSREYALKNSKFAKELINHFLLPKGETPDECFDHILMEIEACFVPLNPRYRSKYKPYLDWNLITHRLYKLVQKGELWVEHGHVYMALYMALMILDKIGKMYIEDEVWNDQNLDGDDLSVDATLELLMKVIDADIIQQDMLIDIGNELIRMSEMEANVEYGVFDFREVQKMLALKIV